MNWQNAEMLDTFCGSRINNDILPGIVRSFFKAINLGPNEKQVAVKLGLQEVVRTDLREIATPWKRVKCEAFNRLRFRRSMRSCVALMPRGAAASC